MKQLSGLDATFLYIETPEMPMHVGALHVFELPAGFRGRFVTALRRHMATRLPASPALRWAASCAARAGKILIPSHIWSTCCWRCSMPPWPAATRCRRSTSTR